MIKPFSFSNDGRSYTIDNTYYDSGVDMPFSLHICPRCQRKNAPSNKRCDKCGGELNDDSLRIAVRKRAIGVGALIGCILSGFFTTVFAYTAGIRGALPTWIITGACIFVGTSLLAPRKIKIDVQASNDYQQYLGRIRKIKENAIIEKDEEVIAQYDLTKHCYKCGKETEKDSVYCSNCGKQL